MDMEEALFALFFFLVIVVPVLAVTARFVFMPMVEALARLRETPSGGANSQAVERWMLQLEGELEALRAEVRQLREAEAFHEALVSGQPTPPVKSPLSRAPTRVAPRGIEPR